MADAGKDQGLDANTIIDGEFAVVPEDMPAAAANEDGVIDAQASSNPAPAPQAIAYTAPQVLDMMLKAKTLEALDDAGGLIGELSNEQERRDLAAKYDALRAEMPA
jgi:recombination protein RecT